MPIAAAQRTGFSRWVHVKAGELAILFVCAVTLFSLGDPGALPRLPGLDDRLPAGISHAALILSVLPHALPELTALFLPLAAWLIASRRGEWNQLLAATFITVALAIPVLIASATIEVYVWPQTLGRSPRSPRLGPWRRARAARVSRWRARDVAQRPRAALRGGREAVGRDLWMAWPKRSSAVETDITEDVVREVALPAGMVDSKSARSTRPGRA